MANVNIKFNNKDYLLSCDDGQEESLIKLTEFLDKKYSELKNQLGNIGENKLLLITTIKLIDDYFNLKERVSSQKGKLEKLSSKFIELKSLAISYKDSKDLEIKDLNKKIDKFKNMIEENNKTYELILDRTTQSIEKIIHTFKPEVVYTHTPHDINVDHIACYRAVLTATRPKKNTNVKRVYAFEVPSSSEWNFTSIFTPNTFVDITNEMKYKIKALQAYTTELGKYPHPRSSKALEAIGSRWGSVSGFLFAEAFCLVRSLED